MEMESTARRIESLCRMYSKGIFCAAEFWNLVVGTIWQLPVVATLSGLSSDVQRELRAIYAERPASLMCADDLNPIRKNWTELNRQFSSLYAPTYAIDVRQSIYEWLKNEFET
jgi:hypothetical protein